MLHELLAKFFDQYAELVAATQFLSVIPLPGPPHRFGTNDNTTDIAHLKLGSAYFPCVGLLLAVLLYLVQRFFNFVQIPSLALAALLVVALVLLTGGLHLDGLMDSCDGLLGGRTSERRMEIMRDSRVGSFGVLGGICVLLLKFALFASMEPRTLALALFIILPSARWAMVLALRIFPSARSTGLGVTFRQSVTMPRLITAGASSLLIAALVGHLVGVLAWGTATLLAYLLGHWITRLINGLTGDSYGAIEEITEVVVLLLLVCMHRFL